MRFALDDVDGHAAFGQPGGGRQAGDPCSDHDDPRPVAATNRVRQAGRRGKGRPTRIGHRGASARKVCTMLRCQPGIVSLRTAVKPLARKRSRKAAAPSNPFTLRRRYL